MNNIIKYLVILSVLLYLPQSGWCATYIVEINGINYSISGDYVTVIAKSDGTKYSGNITIPEKIEYNSATYMVNSIGSTFAESPDLFSIELPKTVTGIPDNAFTGCVSLEEISFKASVLAFGSNSFRKCEKLKSVYIEDLASWCQSQFHTIKGANTSLATYYLSSNPLQHGADLYVKGNKIVNLSIPESISSISAYAFYGCSSIETLVIPSSVKNIYKGAFEKCLNLREISIYSDVSYGDGFETCSSLESLYFYGSGNSYYSGFNGSDPFSYCKKLTTVRLPSQRVENEVKYSSDFYQQRAILKNRFPYVKEYILPEGIKRIAEGIFSDCDSLQTINIPSSVETVGECAFYGCKSLKRVDIADISSWCNILFGIHNENGASTYYANPLHYGADLYLNDEKVTELVIPNTVSKIKQYAFIGCKSIKSVFIPNSVKGIEMRAFEGCSELAYVNYPETEINFARDIFSSSPLLVSAGPYRSGCSVEYGWTDHIPDYAFCDMHRLATVFIPSSISSIGDYAFSKLIAGEQKIYTTAENPPTISSNTFFDYNATLFVPRGCSQTYTSAAYWKNFNIIELIDIKSIEIEKKQYDIIVGDSTEVEVTILPDKATYKNLYWSVEEPQIAQIDNGVVWGLKTGTTRVTAKTTDGTDLTATCVINVTNPVQSISLSKKFVELEAEESETITASCTPSNADDVTISWHSKDATIATVTEGRINAIRVGETEVVAKSVNGVEAICKVIVNPTIATSIKLNKNSLSLTTGNSDKLEATVLPAKTTNKVVKWESTASNIVNVDGSGNVKALSNGTAKISAITTDGSNLSDECVVTVTTLATSISLNQNKANLIVGQSLSLNAIIQPSTTSNQNIVWKSNNNSCASVTSDGTVSANATGTATITAITSDETNLSASCVIVVTNPVISVTLDKTSAEMMVGQQIVITASCIPSNADNTSITWSSSDNTVASIVNGVVTARELGKAIITASSANGVEATCSINVVPTPISSLTLNESTISIVKNQTFTLSCTIYPEDATYKELIWSSDNENVAKVNANGDITGMSTGETTIFAKAKSNPKIVTSCKVVVTTPVTSIQLDQERIELFVEDEVQLRVICLPVDADNNNVRWTSSDINIADISAEGYVSTKNEGNVRITVTTTDGTNLSASCDITIKRIKQSIDWNNELSFLHEGGEMTELIASSSSGLPVRFTSSDDNIVSIFDLGDVIYANPVNSGTAYITAYQEGNYKYEPVDSKKEVEVVENPGSTTKTLIAYYSQSVLIDGIVAELANQIASSNVNVYTQKIEPTNERINSANTNSEVRDSVMNIISLFPNDENSYPEIKTINANISDYDNVIMVYPLWNTLMAAPMQTFRVYNNDLLEKKSNAYIEYDLYDETDSSSNAKVLRFNSSNIDDMSNLIEDWLNNSEATGILHLQAGKFRPTEGLFDLQGKKITRKPVRGIFIENGVKILKK